MYYHSWDYQKGQRVEPWVKLQYAAELMKFPTHFEWEEETEEVERESLGEDCEVRFTRRELRAKFEHGKVLILAVYFRFTDGC